MSCLSLEVIESDNGLHRGGEAVPVYCTQPPDSKRVFATTVRLSLIHIICWSGTEQGVAVQGRKALQSPARCHRTTP
jgi:hypothetical protein